MVRKYAIAKGEIIDKWAIHHPNVMTWLAKYPNEDVRIQNAQMLWIFCDWANIEPADLLALKNDISSHEAEELLDKFVADKTIDVPNSVKWNSVNAVKGFFASHYRDLAKRSGTMSLDKVKPYRKPTKDDLRKMWDVCYNPRDRSMVVSMPNSTGIAKESLMRMQWKHIEEGWENVEIPHISLPPELIKGHGHGKYKDVRQETFLTPEAKEDLLKYKRWMEEVKGVTFTPETNVYVKTEKPVKPITYKALGKIVSEVARRARVGYSLHDARRYVQTALEEARLPANWARKIRGRKVRGEESPYSRPEIKKLREAFREALPYLMFRKESSLMELQRRQEIGEQLTDKMVRGEPFTDEDRANVKRYGIRLRERAGRPKPEENADCPNGKNCSTFKEINESELLNYLNDGWSITHNLQNGRVIVSIER